MRTIIYILVGYLSGSVLYARVFAKLFGKNNFTEMSRDNNPGTSNAFMYGGFWCGVMTLVCDLLKGFLPVFLYIAYMPPSAVSWLPFALVIAAPVIGHDFPIFYWFRGGKGIAVTFGCLLGLLPIWQPLMSLAVFFIFFSVGLRITPHYYRTLVTYICALIGMIFIVDIMAIKAGFFIISSVVISKLLVSKEDKKRMEVKLLWTH